MADEKPNGMDFFGLDNEGAGTRFEEFVTALGVWGWMQENRPSVADAMLAFNCSADVVLRGVEEHPWMLIDGEPGDPPALLRLDFDGE